MGVVNGGQLAATRNLNTGGVTGAISRIPFMITTPTTVQNTTTETSLLSTVAAIGSKTIPANYFTSGSLFKIYMTGTAATALVLPSITMKLYFGATVLASSNVTFVAQLVDPVYWEFTATCIVTSTGASGAITSGTVMWLTSLGALGPYIGPQSQTVDTTAAGDIDVKVTWGTASNSNVIRCLSGYVELMG